MSYGWVVVVGILAVILVSQVGLFDAVPCDKVKFGFSQISPVDWGVYVDSNVVVLSIENWAGNVVDVGNVSVDLGGGVFCNYSGGFSMSPGEAAVIVLWCGAPEISGRYSDGDCFVGEVSFDFRDHVSMASYVSRGSIRGAVETGAAPSTTSTTTTTTTTSTTTTVPTPPLVELNSPFDGYNIPVP